jgi:hypothetical protein
LANTVQHDDPSCGDVVGDAGLLSAEVEAELSEIPVELSGERLAEQGALVGQQVDVPLGVAELIVGEAVEPGGHLGFKLDRTHGTAAMLLARRLTAPERGASLVPLSCHFGRLPAWATVASGGRWMGPEQGKCPSGPVGDITPVTFATVRVAGSNPVVRSRKSPP